MTKETYKSDGKDPDRLSPESFAYLKSRPKEERAPLGQFLTPRILREALVSQIPLRSGMRVLDPGVGTGEFLKQCLESCSEVEVHGWDVDSRVLEVAAKLVPSAQLLNRSALDEWDGPNFDVVVGNPPYFEIRGIDSRIRKSFEEVISGRPNIFALFFQAGFNVLRNGGYLAYVVPPSMNNGAYFNKLREFILRNFSIEFFDVYEDAHLFEDAQTAVQLILLRKGSRSSRHWVDLGELSGSPLGRKVFVSNPAAFAEEFEGRSTVYSSGYQAVTGSVVWNTRTADLSDTQEQGFVPLIWAHNISSDGKIFFQTGIPRKPQFVREEKHLVGPAIVVNRITGSVGSGELRCALVPRGQPFVGENHVNVIMPRSGAEQTIGWEQLLGALRAPGINRRVRQLTGNTQLSATELTFWVPLDLKQ